MKTTQIHRTVANDTYTVSTIHVRDGNARCYETTIVVSPGSFEGFPRTVVLEPLRSADKFAAGLVHDSAVDWAKGSVDTQSLRHDHWTNQVKMLEDHAVRAG